MNQARNAGPLPSSPASLRAALAGIDAELAALRTRVEELTAARKPIVKGLKAIVYPILTIPVEIAAEIFLRCVDWAEISDKCPCEPLVLASVCKQWHCIMSTSSKRPPARGIHQKGNASKIWRRDHIGDNASATARGGDVIAALIPHSTRWKSLICDFSTGFGYPTGLDTIQGRIPHLEKLCIKFAGHPVPTELLSIFSDAPLLREAHLDSLAFDPFPLPWGQLTTLDLAGQFSVSYVEILQRTPQLQILHLQPGGEVFVAQTALTLHHLHTLKLRDNRDHAEQENPLLNALILPALRHLDLGLFADEFVYEVLALLSRSRCSLASISLRSPTLSLQSAILDEVSTPTELRITDIAWTSLQLESFFVEMHGSSGTLPNLRTLAMSSQLVDLPYAAMAKMLASRQGSEEGCARLESFQFTLPQLTPVDEDSEEFAMVDNVSAQGCRVEIQGLKGLKLNLGSYVNAAHSYTLTRYPWIF
ncbi:hypothetical protein C8R46DRAFT_1354209 [Mycena filopes]|nr:hypothetical protein C8R46DRAFT_1354209 [Mycena filopes]